MNIFYYRFRTSRTIYPIFSKLFYAILFQVTSNLTAVQYGKMTFNRARVFGIFLEIIGMIFY